AHVRPHHRIEQRKRAADIVLEIASRLAHGLADGDERGEVDDCVGRVLPHQFGEGIGLQEVKTVKAAGGHVVLEALREVVHYGNVISTVEEKLDGVGPDISRAAGHEYFALSHKPDCSSMANLCQTAPHSSCGQPYT